MSMGALAEVIVGLARRAGESEAPVSFAFGQVVNEEPLEVRLEQRLLLPEELLILTEPVIGAVTRLGPAGAEGAEDTAPVYRVEHNLCKFDRVLLARVQGGQAYVILSRYYAVEREKES